jgi:hypothetical protein
LRPYPEPPQGNQRWCSPTALSDSSNRSLEPKQPEAGVSPASASLEYLHTASNALPQKPVSLASLSVAQQPCAQSQRALQTKKA